VNGIPTITSDRLRFRPWREDDLPALAGFMASDRSRFIGGPINEDDSWRRIALFIGHWSIRGFGPWAIEEIDSGSCAGYAGLWHPHGFPEAEVLYTLYDGFGGKGYAQEAALRCRRYAYETLGWRTVVSYIHSDNAASKLVAERVGARFDGTASIAFGIGAWRQPEIWRHPSPEQSSHSN